jgi:hypothetical protein
MNMTHKDMLDKFEEIYTTFDFEEKKQLENIREINSSGNIKASCLVKEIAQLSVQFVDDEILNSFDIPNVSHIVFMTWKYFRQKCIFEDYSYINENDLQKISDDFLIIYRDAFAQKDKIQWLIFCCEFIRNKLYLEFANYKLESFHVEYKNDKNHRILVAYSLASAAEMMCNNHFEKIYFSKEYPRYLIDQIVSDRVTYEPILIDFIESLVEYPEMMRDSSIINQMIVATIVLSHWKSKLAFHYIVGFLKEFGGEFEIYLEDFDLEELNNALIRTYNGDTDKLKELINCTRVSEFVRTSGFTCLHYEYSEKTITKQYLLDFYKVYLLERDDIDFLVATLLSIDAVNPYELQTEINDAIKYIRDKEEFFMIKNEDFEFSPEKQSKFDQYFEHDLSFIKRHDDPHERIEFWFDDNSEQYKHEYKNDNHQVQLSAKPNKKKIKNKKKQVQASKKKNRKKK